MRSNNNMQLSLCSVVMAVPVTTVLYVLVGVNNPTWAGETLTYSFLSAIVINITGYFFVANNSWKESILVNAGFSAAIIVITLYAVALSFPGSVDRIGNRGANSFAYIGLINYFLLALLNLPASIPAVILTICISPFVVGVIYLSLSKPLWTQLERHEAWKNCLLQGDIGNRRAPPTLTRIRYLSDVKLGVFIGEHTPRIYSVSGTTVREWSFTLRRFKQDSFELTIPPKACQN